MKLIEIIEENEKTLSKKADTLGGEYKGPCPWCGGKDRFTVWPFKDRYICRKCKRNGDSIDFLQKKRGMTYHQACEYLGVKTNFKKKTKISYLSPKWTPRLIKIPSLKWQEQARIILNRSINYLSGPFGKRFNTLLIERGIDASMIKRYSLGYNRKDIYASRNEWGLPESLNETGEPKKLWIPRGHVIPMLDKAGNILRLRIRRTLAKNDDSQKYIIITGSHMGFMQFEYNKKNPSMILESELDSILCDSLRGDRVNFYAVGNASARPDVETHEKLINSKILFSLDNDEAGKAEFDWWSKQYLDTIEKFCPTNKDVGEFFQAGGDVGKWIDEAAGLKNEYSLCTYDYQPLQPDTAKMSQEEFIRQYEQIPTPEPEKITKPSHKLTVDTNTDRSCLNGYYCNFIKHKFNKEFNYHRKVCMLQEDNEDSIFDKGCPKGLWY